MRAVFIRHGESTGNAGVPCHDLATIELTERSRGQARHVAASWDKAPENGGAIFDHGSGGIVLLRAA